MIGFSLSDAIGISRFSLSHLPARFLLLQQPLAFDLIGEGRDSRSSAPWCELFPFDLFSASAAVRGDAPATTSSTFPKFESYQSVTTTNNNRHSGARVTREARHKRARNP